MNIQINDIFPSFSLNNQDGIRISNADFSGKWLVIYFYPKDDTNGCTIQGKNFTEFKEKFDKEDISIVGVSQDSILSHKNFHTKFSFLIDLLSDEKCDFINAIGLPQLEWEGNKYWGRTTIVIDENNIIRKIYEDVKPEEHHNKILSDIKDMSELKL